MAREACQIGHFPDFARRCICFRKGEVFSRQQRSPLVGNSSEAIIMPMRRSFGPLRKIRLLKRRSLGESIAEHSISLVASASKRSRLSLENVKKNGIINGQK